MRNRDDRPGPAEPSPSGGRAGAVYFTKRIWRRLAVVDVKAYRYGRWHVCQIRNHRNGLWTIWVGPYVLRIEAKRR